MALRLKNTPPYYDTEGGIKLYVALINQNGTDAPQVTVFTNTFGGEIVWTREGAGYYHGTLIGAFPSSEGDKTWMAVNEGQSPLGTQFRYGIETDDNIYIETAVAGTDTDGKLNLTPIEIRQYP